MKEQELKYDTEMPAEEWTGGMYKNLGWIKTGIWCLVLLEVTKFVVW